jgi:hypothetical protein
MAITILAEPSGHTEVNKITEMVCSLEDIKNLCPEGVDFYFEYLPSVNLGLIKKVGADRYEMLARSSTSGLENIARIPRQGEYLEELFKDIPEGVHLIVDYIGLSNCEKGYMPICYTDGRSSLIHLYYPPKVGEKMGTALLSKTDRLCTFTRGKLLTFSADDGFYIMAWEVPISKQFINPEAPVKDKNLYYFIAHYFGLALINIRYWGCDGVMKPKASNNFGIKEVQFNRLKKMTTKYLIDNPAPVQNTGLIKRREYTIDEFVAGKTPDDYSGILIQNIRIGENIRKVEVKSGVLHIETANERDMNELEKAFPGSVIILVPDALDDDETDMRKFGYMM